MDGMEQASGDSNPMSLSWVKAIDSRLATSYQQLLSILSGQADFSEAGFLSTEPLSDDLVSADLLWVSFLEGLADFLGLLA